MLLAILISVAAVVAIFFLYAWIFQLIYNAAVPAFMNSVGIPSQFKPLNYWHAMVVMLLLGIIGGAFSTTVFLRANYSL